MDSLRIPADRTCDTCKFARTDRKMAPGKFICFGAPPVPCLVAAQADRFGRPQFNFINQRPVLDPGTPACSLYQFEIKAAAAAS